MTNHPHRARAPGVGMLTVYYYSPHADQSATHARRTGFARTGYRVAADIDVSRLSSRARRLLDLMDCDLSGLLEGDDLVPRAVVKERRIDIERAAELLGLGEDGVEAARAWRRAYGEHCEECIEARPHLFMGLYHAASRGDLVNAINAHADHPGLHVRNNAGEHQISSAAHEDDARSATAWAHMLKPMAERMRMRKRRVAK